MGKGPERRSREMSRKLGRRQPMLRQTFSARRQFRPKQKLFTVGEPKLGPHRSFVPNVITMFYRFMFLALLQIAWIPFSALIIMGEDVFWKLNFVDQWYSNFGTNPLDMWTFVYLTVYMLIWVIGVFWAV